MARSLRYSGDADRIKVGGLYVRAYADEASQDDVVAGIKRFWLAAGATEEAPEPVETAVYKQEGLLGFVVVPAAPDIDGETWIGVRDSVHYSDRDWSDELAQALNHYLGVPTFAFDIGPKTRLVSVGESRYFGLAEAGLVPRKATKARSNALVEADRFPHPFFTYSDAAQIKGASWLQFRFGERTGHTLEFVKEFWKS